MARSAPALTAALLVCLPACALAQAGDYQLEGRLLPNGHSYTVQLHVAKVAGGYTVERTQRFATGKRSEKPARTWRSTRVSGSAALLRVTFEEAKAGISGALSAIGEDDDDDDVDTARYTFSDDGRVREWFTPADGRAGVAFGRPVVKTLKLVRERKLAPLFEGSNLALETYEASGVVHVDGKLHIVFDNRSHIAVVPLSLSKTNSKLIKTRGNATSDFEGISYDASTKRFFTIVEAKRYQGERRGRVWELDQDFDRKNREWLDDYELPSANKGFEGVAFVSHGGREFLLGLLEGNNGEANREALERGKGELRLFRRSNGSDNWRHRGKVKLPKAAFFFDYSGVDVKGDRIVVVSQTSSAIWVGKLDKDTWTIEGDGTVYRFPRLKSRPLYATVEGITWVSEKRIAVVSDASKDDTGRAKEQSVHLFDLP